MSDRKFHFTTYPFGSREITRTVPAADVNVGDWFCTYVDSDGEHYYRVIHVNKTDPEQIVFSFHGRQSTGRLYAHQVLLVRDPVAEEVISNPIQEMMYAVDEIDEVVASMRMVGLIESIPDLLDTKAGLLIAITEARRSHG